MATKRVENSESKTLRLHQRPLSDEEYESLCRYAEVGDAASYAKVFTARARAIPDPANLMGGRYAEIQFEGLVHRMTKSRLERFIESHRAQGKANLLENLKSILNLLWKAAPLISNSLSGKVPFNSRRNADEVFRWQEAIRKALSSVEGRISAEKSHGAHAKKRVVDQLETNRLVWQWDKNLLPYLFETLIKKGAIQESARNFIWSILDGAFEDKEGKVFDRKYLATRMSQSRLSKTGVPRNHWKVDQAVDSIKKNP